MNLKLTTTLLILLCNFCFSQTKITGIIIDEDKKPIENINVILKNLENKTIDGDITSSSGHFSLTSNVNRIKIQIVQFNEIYYEKELEAITDINLGNIEINNSKILQEVTIVSKKSKLKKELGKFIVDNISTSQFSKGKNTFEVLNYIPILNSTENGISIFNKGDATIFINGKPVGDNETALNMIKSIPANNIRKVEIIANPDSKFEANNKNGIINIVLKNNENEGLRGSISSTINQSYFNSQSGNGFISYSKKKLSITSGINLDNNKYFSRYNYSYNNLVSNQQTEIQSNTIDKTKNQSYFLNSDYKLNDKNSIGLQFNYRLTDRNSLTVANNIFKNINSDIINATSLNNISNQTPNNNSFRGNINFTHQLDSLGSNIYIDNTQITRRTNSKNNFNYINSNIPNEIFNQNQDEKFNVNATKLDVTKIINENNKLFFGGNFIYSDIKNIFFYGNFDGINYVSDPLQTNSFSYTDKTIAGYINYEKIFNEKWEGKIGFRLENFSGNGSTKTNSNETNINNTYLFPSFSVLFIPNDVNEISIDASLYILRPYYSQLNPFIRYNSSNSYTISNPNLLPTLSYELNLDYSYLNKYFFNVTYIYDKNLFNEFDIVLPSDLIQKTTANYGNGNEVNMNLVYINTFFNKNLNFSASFNYIYRDSKGFYNDYDLSFSNNFYSLKLKNQINLSKKKDFNIGIVYGIRSANKSVVGNLQNFQSLDIDMTKSYKSFNFIFGASNLTFSKLEIEEIKNNYNFQKNIDYFKSFSITIRYNFGNKKVKKIEDKSSEINKRL
jgi:hypothetical protein